MKQILFLSLVIISLTFLIGCSKETTTPVETTDSSPVTAGSIPATVVVEPSIISLTELAKHNNENDCWIAIHDKVYDVTGFDEKHGGGKAVYEGCGIDATELFETRPMGSGTPHSEKARGFLPNFYLGDLE